MIKKHSPNKYPANFAGGRSRPNRQARRYGRKYLVINVGGDLLTLSKQELTLLVRRGYFYRGITAAHIEAHALHVALPRPSSR